MIDRACISLGEKCNLKCSYCHFHNEENGKLSGEPQEFKVSELIEIIDQIKSYSVMNSIETFKIGIVGSGEPLLQYRKIVQLIEYVKENEVEGLAFYTITNGTILNDGMLDFFFNNKDIIQTFF